MTVVHGVRARDTSTSSPGSFSLALEKRPGDEVGDTYALTILGLQIRDKATMLMFNTINTLINTLHESGVKMPEERNALSLIPNMADVTYVKVTCKTAVKGACFTPFLIINNRALIFVFCFFRKGQCVNIFISSHQTRT